MDITARTALAANLAALMRHHHLSQNDLAIKSGISQRTVSNMLRPETKVSPTTDSLASVARAPGSQPWLLLRPQTPLELLLNHSVDKLLENYCDSSQSGRDNIERIAENEARYSLLPRPGQSSR